MTKPRTYSSEFKVETASLIVDQNDTYKQASDAMNVGHSALRRWVSQLKAERGGETPDKGNAITPEQQEIQALKKEISQLKMEKSILKKASALLISDQYLNIQ